MFNFITFARQALLAASLVLFSGAASAGPSYLVTIHTQAYSGESGLFDFSMGGSDGSALLAIADLWDFSGNFGDEQDRGGSVSGDLASGVNLTNAGATSYLTQWAILGDDFSFKVRFSGDYALESEAGSQFAVLLYDAGLGEVLDYAVQFQLVPFNNGEPSVVLVDANPLTTEVTELAATDVPEPSQLLLMLSALALAGAAMRASRNRGK